MSEGLYCQWCKDGSDVVARQYYVGGHGYRLVQECRDHDSCLERQGRCAMCWALLAGSVLTSIGWLCPECYRHRHEVARATPGSSTR